jgi:hypothetical protein
MGVGGPERAGVQSSVQQTGGAGDDGRVQRPRACPGVVAAACLGTPLGGGDGSASDGVLNDEKEREK